MNALLFRIAIRYLFSKKSTNAINIITGISMVAMMLISMAFIIILSGFNGFESLVVSLYKSFNPDILITAREGKVFVPHDDLLKKISSLEEVAEVSLTLEENAIFRYNEHEYIAIIKGVDRNYEKVTEITDKVIYGDFLLLENGMPYTVLGAGVAGALNVNVENVLNTLQVFLPKRGKETLSLDPSQAFVRKNIRPAGVFTIQQEFDSKYVLAPLEFVRELLNYENEISALEVKIKTAADAKIAKEKIKSIAGENFLVKDRFEQNEFLYRVMRIEKWAVYAILTLVLIIAAFNIIGSLSMLVIEKTKDIAILKTLGADNKMIRRIFLLEGLFTSLIGSFAGICLGVILCLIQIHFEVIKLQGSGTFVIDSYPVEMQWQDFFLVAATVILIAVATSWIPAQRAATREIVLVQD